MHIKFVKILAVLSLTVLAAVVGETIVTAAPADMQALVTTTYTADNSTFPNPERGFHNRYDIVPGGDTDFSRSVNSGNRLVHSYVKLDNYRTSNIPSSVLNQLRTSLTAARNQGVKVILRVAYNQGPYPNSLPDATEAWISTHLSQLKPAITENADVIAYMEAGFIGAWGEWHTSTNGLDTNMAAKIRIFNNMLATYPSSIQVALRYPSDVRALINGGVDSARVGNHQDCFLASEPDDWGTWARDPLYTVQQDKDYIASVGLNHPVGGETCNSDSPRVTCSTVLNEMAWMHFSELNEDFETGVINAFKSGGCYETIKQKMGYRFRLTTATYPTIASSGGSFGLQATIVNDGWASPFNARPVFAVFDGAGGTYTVQLPDDPRSWKSGQQTTINQSFTLPSMPNGTYRLSLWLPDNASGLRSNANYSIRFANQNTWDSTKGYNVLANSITITSGPCPPNPTPSAQMIVSKSSVTVSENFTVRGTVTNLEASDYRLTKYWGDPNDVDDEILLAILRFDSQSSTFKFTDYTGYYPSALLPVSGSATSSSATFNVKGRELGGDSFHLQVSGFGKKYNSSCVLETDTSVPVTIYSPSDVWVDVNVANPSFESGTTSWSKYGTNVTIASVTTVANTGAKSVLVSDRQTNWTGVQQNITSPLTASGPGAYYYEAYVRTASGTQDMHITINLVYGGQNHYVGGPNIKVGTAFTKVSNSANLTWSGTLTAAYLYVESGVAGQTGNFYADDFKLAPNTSTPPTAIPPTAIPPTAIPPTAIPPTPGPGNLVLDNFDGVPAWSTSTTNDLGKWAGANSFANGAGVASGGALALKYSNNGWFGSDVNQDISGKTYLVFVIKGAAGGEQSHFKVKLGGVEKTFAAFSGDTITTAYKTIRINMSTNGVNRASPGQLQMSFWLGKSGTTYIDEIRFE